MPTPDPVITAIAISFTALTVTATVFLVRSVLRDMASERASSVQNRPITTPVSPRGLTVVTVSTDGAIDAVYASDPDGVTFVDVYDTPDMTVDHTVPLVRPLDGLPDYVREVLDDSAVYVR